MVKMFQSNESKIKQYVSKYKNPDFTRKDAVQTLEFYKGLRAKLEPFIFNDGSRKELFNLQGTIPVCYKGTVYNIPICIWIMDTHPNNAPMCYVVPTKSMKIKVSNYVDHTGRIYLPYLHDWIPHKSSLMSLIQIMRNTFGDHPPVYQVPINEQLGHTYTYSYRHGVMQPGGYPPTTQYGGSATPYPPYPVSSDVSYPNLPYPSTTTNFPMPGGPTSGSFPPYPTGNMTGGIQPASGMPENVGNNTYTVMDEHIRASLLSAVGDKLRRRLREDFSQMRAELETLHRTQMELRNGSARLTELFTKLEKEKSELEKNINVLQDKEVELLKDIEKLTDNQSIDVDEAVTTIAPLYKQMLNAFVEEAAIEDAIYYLAEGLRSGILDLDTFLKQVRQLSRRQFMLRALMSLCRQKAGLSG